jgi:hypothetical protein
LFVGNEVLAVKATLAFNGSNSTAAVIRRPSAELSSIDAIAADSNHSKAALGGIKALGDVDRFVVEL